MAASHGLAVAVTELDRDLMRRCLLVARRARAHGNHPFGALLTDRQGSVLLEVENTVHTDHDLTAHAELNLLQQAARRLRVDLGVCTMYASTEPCPMCACAGYWAGVGRIVYGLSSGRLHRLTHAANVNTMHLPARDILQQGVRPMIVDGPVLEDEAQAVHEGYWREDRPVR